MKVLLVNPPCRIPALIPLGLGYIASVLRDEGHDVSLIDLNAKEESFPSIEKMLDLIDFDLIGIGGLSTTYSFVKRFSLLAKQIKPHVKIIAGNMVSTAHPELLLKNSDVDICVIDEGEETIKELLAKIRDFPNIENVKGILFRKGERLIATPMRERIKNLDSLPFPAWDLFPIKSYLDNPIYNEYGKRSMNISTVRGCPFKCIFCSRPFGSYVTCRSPKGIIDEINELKRRYKIKFIGFSDDLFTINRKWVLALCDEMVKSRVDVGWGASARVNLVDEMLLKNMRGAGCEILSYGFESGCQSILDNMDKRVKVAQAEKAIDMTRKSGITISGSFMIGMIGETEETIRQTIDFIKRTGLAIHRFFYTTPFPGTELYEIAKRKNRIPLDEDAYVSSLGEMHRTFLVNLTDMPDERLKDLKERAELKVKENFSLRTRFEILNEELRRISANFWKGATRDGMGPTMGRYIGKLRERIKPWRTSQI